MLPFVEFCRVFRKHEAKKKKNEKREIIVFEKPKNFLKCRKQPPEYVLKIFRNFTTKKWCWSSTLVKMLILRKLLL